MAVTAMILFLPKVLSLFLILVVWRRGREFGGAFPLVVSAVLEILLSALFAPIRMVFHSRFVVQNLAGRTVQWKSQGREDAETSWRDALRHHGLDTIWASAWGSVLYWLNPGYFWWLTPILVALVLSVPLSVFVSRVRWGDRARRWRLFLIPEELDPPFELRALSEHWERLRAATEVLPEEERDGFVRAAVDPFANAWRRSLLAAPRRLAPAIRARRLQLLERALREGPAALAARERRMLLYDPDLVDALHRGVWSLEDEEACRWSPRVARMRARKRPAERAAS
jgi:membrane glycosyltransferase